MTLSASDAYYNQLLRDIAEGKERSRLSDEARKAGAKKYWYFIYQDYCPVCGHEDVSKERVYTERPEEYRDRHRVREVYNYCDY